MVYDADRAWWYALPDSTSMAPNSLGLRGPELGPKQENEIRILSLGDSTIWGHGVKDADVFSIVAAAELSERWERPVRSIIGAQPGHDVEQSDRVLASRGRVIDPDWVLIGNQWSDMFYDESPAQIRAPGQTAPFALYRTSHRLLGRFLNTKKVGWLDPDRGVGMPREGAQPRTPLPAYRSGLTALVRRAQEQLGARVALVVLPAPIDWHAEGLPRFVAAYRDTLRSVAAEWNAPVVEGAEWFKAHGASNAHFYDPVHPSVEGHRLLADAVVATLSAISEGSEPQSKRKGN
jgi:hypothetical protein